MYDNAIIDNGWSYKLSIHSDDVAHNNTYNDVTNWLVAPFSPKAFLNNLICFIIADDQVYLNDFMFFYTLTPL